MILKFRLQNCNTISLVKVATIEPSCEVYFSACIGDRRQAPGDGQGDGVGACPFIMLCSYLKATQTDTKQLYWTGVLLYAYIH